MKNKEDKLRNGNSLETQFWNDNIEVDTSTEFMQEVQKMWAQINDEENNKKWFRIGIV